MSSFTQDSMLLVGFPSAGLVGAFAISYLVNDLKMQRSGELDIGKDTPSYNVIEGNVYGPVQIYKKDKVYAMVAAVPLNMETAYRFINSVMEFAKKEGIERVLVPRGMEVLGKDAKPETLGLAVNKNSKELLKKYGLPSVDNATIVGSDAGIVSALKNSDIQNLVLYTICRMRLPDTEAIIMAIKTLAKIMDVKVETSKIKEKLNDIQKQNKQMIEETRKALRSTPQRPASMPMPGVA